MGQDHTPVRTAAEIQRRLKLLPGFVEAAGLHVSASQKQMRIADFAAESAIQGVALQGLFNQFQGLAVIAAVAAKVAEQLQRRNVIGKCWRVAALCPPCPRLGLQVEVDEGLGVFRVDPEPLPDFFESTLRPADRGE